MSRAYQKWTCAICPKFADGWCAALEKRVAATAYRCDAGRKLIQLRNMREYNAEKRAVQKAQKEREERLSDPQTTVRECGGMRIITRGHVCGSTACPRGHWR